MPCSPWIIVGMSQNDRRDSWSATRRFLVLQYRAILSQVNSDRSHSQLSIIRQLWIFQPEYDKLPSTHHQIQQLPGPVSPSQLASLFLPRYLKQVPGFLWVFLNIPATSLSPLKFKSHSCCFLIAFPESGFKQGLPGMWLSL